MWRLITVLKFGCPATDINAHPISTATDACKEWRDQAIEKIAEIHPTAVVMASYTGVTMRGFRTEAPISAEELRLGTRRTLESLSRIGVPVVVLRDTPLPPFDVLKCVARRGPLNLRAADCGFEAQAALNADAYAAQRAAAQGLANIYFLDMNDLICLGNYCPAMQHGLLVYRDDNHLTGKFAETLAPTLEKRLFKLLRGVQSASPAEPR